MAGYPLRLASDAPRTAGPLPGPTRSGRAGERLRDGDPLLCRGTGDDQAAVVVVPPLRDDKAEVQRVAGDPIPGVRWPPAPLVPVRCAQLDPDRRSVGGERWLTA